jgi:uncharacterized lipoprotein YddW (UPF0748 family)
MGRAHAIEPRSAELDGQPATFDPLARTIELAHKAGLRVHAWVAVNLVASSVTLPQDPHHIVRRHPEWLMLPAPLAKSLHAVAPTSPAYLVSLAKWTRGESDQIEGLFLSPIPAASRQYTVSVVKDLVSHYAVDGIHFDYIRYPGEMFDYSAAALTEFRASTLKQVGASAQQRLDRQARVDPTAWAAALPDAWEKFRRDRLTALAHELATTARAARPHITVSSAVIPRADEARTRRLQDWPRWATTGVLDAVCPMAYVTDDTEFGNLVTRARSAAGHVPVWAGIGAFKLSPAEAARQVRVARESGAGGVVMFSYDSMTAESAAPNYLSQLRATLIARHP